MYICYFVIFSRLKECVALHLNKLESSSPKNALSQVWLKLGQWFWRRFSNFFIVFLLFVIISPWKRSWPFILTNLTPHDPRMLCAKFGEIGGVVLEKKMKMWKVYRQTDGQIDGWRITGDQKSSPEMCLWNTNDPDKGQF